MRLSTTLAAVEAFLLLAISSAANSNDERVQGHSPGVRSPIPLVESSHDANVQGHSPDKSRAIHMRRVKSARRVARTSADGTIFADDAVATDRAMHMRSAKSDRKAARTSADGTIFLEDAGATKIGGMHARIDQSSKVAPLVEVGVSLPHVDVKFNNINNNNIHVHGSIAWDDGNAEANVNRSDRSNPQVPVIPEVKKESSIEHQGRRTIFAEDVATEMGRAMHMRREKSGRKAARTSADGAILLEDAGATKIGGERTRSNQSSKVVPLVDLSMSVGHVGVTITNNIHIHGAIAWDKGNAEANANRSDKSSSGPSMGTKHQGKEPAIFAEDAGATEMDRAMHMRRETSTHKTARTSADGTILLEDAGATKIGGINTRSKQSSKVVPLAKVNVSLGHVAVTVNNVNNNNIHIHGSIAWNKGNSEANVNRSDRSNPKIKESLMEHQGKGQAQNASSTLVMR